MPRPEKERKVRELAAELERARATVLTDYRGLTVKDAAELRDALHEAETTFSIVKNRLTKLAMEQAGLNDGLTELLEGPTAIAFVHGDPVEGVKRLVDAAKRFPVLEVKGGFAEGRTLTAEQVRSLAKLESREVMLAKLAGLAKMEMTRLAWMLQALQSRFVSLLQALQETLPGEEQGEAPEQPAESAEQPAEETSEEATASSGDQPDETEGGS